MELTGFRHSCAVIPRESGGSSNPRRCGVLDPRFRGDDTTGSPSERFNLTGNRYRLEAIPQEANNRWGANFEARRTANTDSKPMKLLSYMSCAKLAGLLPPAGPNDTAGIKVLVDYFVSVGLERQTAQQGLSDMLQHAYWKR